MKNIQQDAEEYLGNSSNQSTSLESSSIESDAQEYLSNKQQSNNIPSAMSGIESEFNSSPLSFSNRLALSFAGDNKKEVLKRDYKFVEQLPNGKFAVGDDPRQLQAIDPEGIFNDVLGDLADVANWAAPMIASTSAAAAAIPADIATGNPLPSMMAAGRGMALGEAFNQAVGKKLGVNSNTPKEAGMDIAGAGVGGFAGQGLGVGASKILSMSTPMIAGALDKVKGSIPENSKKALDLSLKKILKVAAAVDENATEVGLKVGFRNLLNPKNMSKSEITNITRETIKRTSEKEVELGGLVDSAVMGLHSATSGKPVIEVSKPFQSLTNKLKEINLLHDGNFMNKNYPNASDRTFFEKLFSELGARKQVKSIPIQDTFSQNVRKESINRYVSPDSKIPFKSLISLKREFSSAYDKLSPRAQGIYTEFMKELGEEAEIVAKEAGDTTFKAANSNFSRFMITKSTLKQAGMDTKNPISTSNFLSNVLDHPDIVQGELLNMDSMIGGNILDRASQWNAAQKFQSTNPSMLRLSMISGALGAGIGGGDISERATRGAVFGLLGLGGLPNALKIGEALGSMVMQSKRAKIAQQISMLQKMLPAIGRGAGFSAKENTSNSNKSDNK